MVSRRIVVGIVASLLLVGSCADDSASSSGAVAEASRTPLGNGVAPASADAVTAALRSRDLAVDRVVELPGSDLQSYVLVVKGEDALASWAAARALVPQTGHYPVIVGGPLEFGGDAATEFGQTLDSAEYLLEDGLTVESELIAADQINAERWFESRAEYLGITSDELEAEPPLPEVDWPNDEFTSDREILSGDPLPLVEIALVPTRNGWEAPAYLLWGGWNDAPMPHEHVAILRSWSERYGAEVVAVTSAVIEMTVARPPHDETGALDLAREHFIYAPDNVWQGTGDLDRLAATLRDATVWYFWWD